MSDSTVMAPAGGASKILKKGLDVDIPQEISFDPWQQDPTIRWQPFSVARFVSLVCLSRRSRISLVAGTAERTNLSTGLVI